MGHILRFSLLETLLVITIVSIFVALNTLERTYENADATSSILTISQSGFPEPCFRRLDGGPLSVNYGSFLQNIFWGFIACFLVVIVTRRFSKRREGGQDTSRSQLS